MRNRWIALLMIFIQLIAMPASVSQAQTTSDKQALFNGTVAELEAWLESPQAEPAVLDEIAACFEDLGNYSQSQFLMYYSLSMKLIAEEDFGYLLEVYLLLMEKSEQFIDFLSKVGHPLGTVEELRTYAVARQCELEGKTDEAIQAYLECVDFYDAAARYLRLTGEKNENAYQLSLELLKKGDLEEAYLSFQRLYPYRDSGMMMESIISMLGYVPGEATPTPSPTKKATPAPTKAQTSVPTVTPKPTAASTRTPAAECDAKGHDWKEATCTEPKTCSRCGKTEGKALGHKWKDATCSTPKTCSRCGEKEGRGLGHIWKAATCTEPKTCSRCGKTDGKALGHKWSAATCVQPKICSVCGATSGKALGHQWKDATCTAPKTCTVCGATSGKALSHQWKDATCTEPKTCTRCGETRGQALGHNWETIQGAANYERCSRCGETRKKTFNVPAR